MPLPYLFRKFGLLVLDKPAGLIVQGNTKGDMEVWELLQKFADGTYGSVHRIDRWTSGLLICGNAWMRSYMPKIWHTQVKKTYLAVIRVPLWSETLVSTALDGKSAVTAFKVLETIGNYSLVECRLVQNGRKHQIRRHLKSLGRPIVGDTFYNGPFTAVRGGQLLHAWKVTVQLETELLSFQAPVPEDILSFGFCASALNSQAMAVAGVINFPTDWVRTPKV